MALKKGYTANRGVAPDGNFAFVLVPAAEVTDPTEVSATLLNGSTSYDATYDIIRDGFNHTPGNEEVEFPRLTLPQALKGEGRQTDTLELRYAYALQHEESDSEVDAFLVEGAKYYGFARYAVDHDEDFAAGQLVDVFPVICGRKRKENPTANPEFTKTVALNPFGKVLDDVAIGAGA